MKILTKNIRTFVVGIVFMAVVTGLFAFPKLTMSVQAAIPQNDRETQAQLEETIATVEENLSNKNTDIKTECLNKNHIMKTSFLM